VGIGIPPKPAGRTNGVIGVETFRSQQAVLLFADRVAESQPERDLAISRSIWTLQECGRLLLSLRVDIAHVL
jgi:hypothetical protein